MVVDRVAALVEELKRTDAGARKRAIDALAEIGPDAEASVPMLIAMLRDRDESIRRRTITALGKIGPRAQTSIPILIDTLNVQDAKIRRMAGAALLLIDPQAVALIEASSRPEPNIRNGAAYTLERLGRRNNVAVPKLIEALAH